MFPEVGGGEARPAELLFTTTSGDPVTVRVTLPATGYSQTLTMDNRAPAFRSLGAASRPRGVGKSDKGVLVTASGPVSVQGVNKAVGATDSFLALPVSALGTEYYAVCYPGDGELNQVAVVAVRDGTAVSLVIPAGAYVQYNGRRYAAGDIITADLDALDTLQVQSLSDLTGLHVYADKPVAAYSGHRAVADRMPIGNTVVQLLPVNVWGRRFFVVNIRGAELQTAVVRLLSSQLDTVLSLATAGDVRQIVLARAGDHYDVELRASDAAVYVSASKPLQAVLVTKVSREATMVPVPAVEQFSSEYRFATPDATQGDFVNYATVLVEKSRLNRVRYDSTSLSALGSVVRWVDVAGSVPLMTAGSIPVSVGQHRVYSEDTRFGLLVHGYTAEEAYALPAGLRLPLASAPVSTSSKRRQRPYCEVLQGTF